MTDIPGTGKISQPEPHKITKTESTNVVSVVNITEIKKKKKETPSEELNWYDQLKYWIFIGLAASLVFIIFSLLNRRFLIFTPLGPLIAVISWYVRKVFTKHSKKLDVFSK